MKEYICVESPNEVEGGMIMFKRELIRCKDCKFIRLTGDVWKCQNRLVMMLCEPNDFCSRAEPKENKE